MPLPSCDNRITPIIITDITLEDVTNKIDAQNQDKAHMKRCMCKKRAKRSRWKQLNPPRVDTEMTTSTYTIETVTAVPNTKLIHISSDNSFFLGRG